MKSVAIAALAASGIVSSAAFAQAQSFEGFDVHAGSGYESRKTKIENFRLSALPNTVITANTSNGSSVPLVIGFGYTAAINDKYTLGAAVDYNVLKSKSVHSDVYVNGVLQNNGGGTNRVKTNYGISFTPGYAIDKETLLYGKVGYSWLSSECTNDDGTACSGVNVNAYDFGLGAKRLINSNAYIFGEASYQQYVKKSMAVATTNPAGTLTYDINGSAYRLIVGAGYKF